MAPRSVQFYSALFSSFDAFVHADKRRLPLLSFNCMCILQIIMYRFLIVVVLCECSRKAGGFCHCLVVFDYYIVQTCLYLASECIIYTIRFLFKNKMKWEFKKTQSDKRFEVTLSGQLKCLLSFDAQINTESDSMLCRGFALHRY